MRRLLFGLLLLLLPAAAHASNCPPLPYTLLNGTVADASQVMANFNSLQTCINNTLLLNNFQQGKIMAGTGPGTFQMRYPAEGVSILDFGTNVCTGSDDSAPLVAAAATGQSVFLPTGICNFNTVQGSGIPYVVQLTAPGQCVLGQGHMSGTTVQSTITSAAIFKTTADGECVENIHFSLATMTDGWVVWTTGGNNAWVAYNFFDNVPGMWALNGSRQSHFDNNYCSTVNGGTPQLVGSSSGTTKAGVFDYDYGMNTPGLHMSQNTCTIGNTGAIYTLLDGNTNTDSFYDQQVNTPLECVHVQDTQNVGTVNFIFSFNYQCQSPSGQGGFDFHKGSAGGGFEYVFDGTFCNAAISYCMFIGPGITRVEFMNINFNGCGKACVYADGVNQIIGPGIISNAGGLPSGGGTTTCSLFANNLCPAVGVGADSISTYVQGIVTSANPANHNEAYGVDVISGARQVMLNANNFYGNTTIGGWHNENSPNTCGNTLSTTAVLVIDEGHCSLESAQSAPTGGVLPAASIVNPVPGAFVDLWRYGPTANFTDTTDTATNLLGALSNPYVGQTWLLNYSVATGVGGNATLAGGSGVTVVSPAVIATGQARTFLCRVTNVGSPAVTCAGQ